MKIVKQFIKAGFRASGFEIRRSPQVSSPNLGEPCPTPLLEFLLQLKAVGFAPAEIYDIGANRGDWTRSIRNIFSESSYLLVEPQIHLQAEVADLLADTKVSLQNCAVSDHTGRASFSKNDWDVTSHLVSGVQAGGASNGNNWIEVDVKRVNDLIAERNRVPDFIKIDAEGFDLEVIDGASDALGKTELFLVEAAVCNPGMKNDVRVVVNRMAMAGYQLAAITEIHPYHWPNGHDSPGLQWLSDLAFLRRDGPLLVALQKPDQNRLRVVKAW